MRKVIAVCSVILATYSFTHAQNPIPNPGFESWINYGPYIDPDGWKSLNEYTWPFGSFTAKQDGSSHSDLYAVKLVTIGFNNIAYPGILGTGELSFATFSCSGGFPVNTAYHCFSGYYKYAPSGSDTCAMFAMLTKWNSFNNHRDTVAIAEYFGGAASSYTLFTDTFTYYLSEIPDTAQIVLSTTKNVLAAPLGSILLIDDLSFCNFSAVTEINEPALKVYPNPASDFLRVEMPSSGLSEQLCIYDLLGRKVLNTPVFSSQQFVSVKEFSEGVFFYHLLSEENKIIASGKFLVKH